MFKLPSGFDRDIQINADIAMWASYMFNIPDKPRYVGKQIDANGVEQEVWEHTFVPRGSFDYRSSNIVATTPRKRHGNVLKRRQRRTAQRRHNQGRQGNRR